MTQHHPVYRLLVQSELQHAASRNMLEGILRFAATHPDWQVQIKGGHPSGESVECYPDWKPDAFITNAQSLKLPRKEFLSLAGRAVAYVNMRPRPDVTLPSVVVTSDDAGLARAAATFLIRKKFASYAFVGSPAGERWSEARRRCFTAALKDLGQTVHVFHPPETSSWERHEKALIAWLRKLPKPCGLWAAYDHRARQVLQTCRTGGLNVPEQIQVLGVDNERYVCEHTVPTLSSIQPDFEAAGYETFAALDRFVREPPTTAHRERLAIPLKGIIERNSTSEDNRLSRRIADAREFIARHAATRIGITDVAASLGITTRQLEIDFRQITGHTVLEELQDRRIMIAKQILRTTSTKIDAIAAFCGFASPTHLKTLFKSRVGLTMSDYRAQVHAAPSES